MRGGCPALFPDICFNMPLITTCTALKPVIDRARAASCVALDTEFVWEHTFYPRLGIIQVGLSDTDCHLVDAPAIDDLSPLGSLLGDASVVKILHDAQQDLWILKHATGIAPKNVFDTRCAAGFAGMSSTLSLVNLLRTCLSVPLSKTETRTDWLRRPLSDEQLAYAADDVRYLPALRNHLLDAVRKRDRAAWLADELALYDDPALYDDRNPDEQYLRVKGTGRLSRRELAIVRELAIWREGEARTRDVPRNRVIDDEAMVEIARKKPHKAEALNRLRSLNTRDIGRISNAILNAVKQGLLLDERDCPPDAAPAQPNPFHEARLDLAMAFLRGRCLSEGIDIALVASRADVKDLVANGRAQSDNRLLKGWRREFLGGDLLDLLNGKHGIGIDAKTRLPELLRE